MNGPNDSQIRTANDDEWSRVNAHSLDPMLVHTDIAAFNSAVVVFYGGRINTWEFGSRAHTLIGLIDQSSAASAARICNLCPHLRCRSPLHAARSVGLKRQPQPGHVTQPPGLIVTVTDGASLSGTNGSSTVQKSQVGQRASMPSQSTPSGVAPPTRRKTNCDPHTGQRLPCALDGGDGRRENNRWNNFRSDMVCSSSRCA